MNYGQRSDHDDEPNSSYSPLDIDSLPQEVVADIFFACLPTNDERGTSALQALAPLTLSWVCSSWRALCLSSPELWTSIALGHSGLSPKQDIPILKLWIQRSAQLPLSLCFNYEVDDASKPVIFDAATNASYIDGVKRLLKTALSCIDRWQSFRIHVLDVNVLEQVFLALVAGAPKLQSLALSTKYLGFFGDIHILNFSKCPKLKNIGLSTPMLVPSTQTNPMTSVTSLDLRFCTSIENCLQWLDLCPALEILLVRLFCSRPDLLHGREQSASAERGVRRLSRLTTLNIHGFSVDADPGPLLDNLDVPALTHLRIYMYDTIQSSSDWTHVNALVERSRPRLEVLSLAATPMSVERIVSCLQHLPYLKELSVRNMWNCDELLVAMMAPCLRFGGCTATLCPELEALDVVNSSWTTETLFGTLLERLSTPDSERRTVTSRALMKILIVNKGLLKQVLKHPGIQICVSRGLEVLGAEAKDLHAAFASPRVVFI